MKKNFKLFLILIIFLFSTLNAQSAQQLNPDFAKAKKFDTGKMWSFDYPPVEHLTKEYGFTPTKEWLEHVRLSALRIPGCTASFISPNGLIMTNHHCAKGTKGRVQLEGENLENIGFYASTLEQERKVPNYYVERLELLVDVTPEVTKAFESGKNEKEKVDNREAKIKELVDKYNAETGLKCQIVSFYNGGVYSIYGYKRYDDVRLVFIPEPWIGEYGGDPDNFTYPRYDLDMALLRVYDNGKPLNSVNYFKWSQNGAQVNEVIFTVGNPGTTRRLKTVAQLEYYRDVVYKNNAFMLNSYFDGLGVLQLKNPSKFEDYERTRRGVGNGQKSTNGTYLGLLNPNLIERKRDFENNLKKAVFANPELKKKYGKVWESIENTRKEMRKIAPKLNLLTIRTTPVWMTAAGRLVQSALDKKKPEADKNAQQAGPRQGGRGQANLFPNEIDLLHEGLKLEIVLKTILMNVGEKDDLYLTLTEGKNIQDAIKNLSSKTIITSKEKFDELMGKTPDEILQLNDPFIKYYVKLNEQTEKLIKDSEEINKAESIQENMLGQAMYAVYGTSIPPDANFTLRLSDGVLASYEYNGTTAPVFTTFYGLYDRYHSHLNQYPWDLPESWKGKDKEIDLSTRFNMISTNDIVGGNSGSAIINKNAEVVGLAFDGNIESLNGNFIYMPEQNRCVAVTSQAILLALDKIYKAERLVNEIKNGVLK